MKHLVGPATFVCLCVSIPAVADFTFDTDYQSIKRDLDVVELQDLAVGDKAYLTWWDLCITKDLRLAVWGNSLIETERNEYSDYVQVIVLPSKMLKGELAPSEKGSNNSKSDAFKRVFRSVLQKYHCEDIARINQVDMGPIFLFSEFEGQTTYSQIRQQLLK